MATCLIGLGANLGDRAEALRRAVTRLAAMPDATLLAQSRAYETAPVGGPAAQPSYLNAAVLIETSLEPQAVLDRLQAIETDLGRRRSTRWGPRTIDLDLLLYDQLILETERLTLPHPRMAFRRFVLEPAAEIAADMIHPTVGWAISWLLEHLDSAAAYVAVTGPIGAGKSQLAKAVAERLSARLIAEPLDAERLNDFYGDPAGQAWQTELEFLDLRARRLDASGWGPPDRLTLSDFWFDQSLAFAAVWLPAARQAEFAQRWQAARAGVVAPKLVVHLDAPGDDLQRRIVARGRPYEQGLSTTVLQRLRLELKALTRDRDVGPVLRLHHVEQATAVEEVVAAVHAMMA